MGFNATNLEYRAGAASAATSGGVTGLNKLWLPIWSGEVIHAYDQYNVFEGLVDHKTISSGREMEYPITGTINLKTAWNAGEELVGGDSSTSSTFSVSLDSRPIAAHFELDNVDLMVTQWEYRAELARQAGLTLANARDKQIGSYIARAALSDGASFTDDPRGSSYNSATAFDDQLFADGDFQHLGNASGSASSAQRVTAALLLLQAIEDFITNLQIRSAPTEGVYCGVDPKAFQDIRSLGVCRDTGTDATNASNVLNVQPMMGGVAAAGGLGGSFMARPFMQDTLQYMGCTIFKSNHLPTKDYGDSANQIGESRYNLDWDAATVEAIIFQSNCVAALSMQGMKVDSVEDVRRNTNFVVASMMSGTGVIRPECAAVVVHGAGTATNVDTRAELQALAATNANSTWTDEWSATS